MRIHCGSLEEPSILARIRRGERIVSRVCHAPAASEELRRLIRRRSFGGSCNTHLALLKEGGDYVSIEGRSNDPRHAGPRGL
jgi:hypothetical protein